MITFGQVSFFAFSLGTTDCVCLSCSEACLGSREAIAIHNLRKHIRW